MENGEKFKAEQPVKMTVRIYNDEFGGQLLFEENQDVVAGSDKAVFAFEQGNVTVRQRTSGLNTATLWVEVESDGQVMTPRLNLIEIDTVNNLWNCK
jgi:ribosomal protein L27